MTDVKPCCCPPEAPKTVPVGPQSVRVANTGPKPKPDVIFWGGLGVVLAGYAWHILQLLTDEHAAYHPEGFAGAVFSIMNQMWVGMVIGIVALGFMSRIPRHFVMAALGTERGWRGVVRAVMAGVLLDLCSHGILMIGAKLYERGATAGQVMAFLISSPWNSFSLTIIMFALIGVKWTLAFIALSMLIGLITGILFEYLEGRGNLPANPNRTAMPDSFKFWPEAKAGLKSVPWSPQFIWQTLLIGLRDSKMILRWLFVGVIIASALRVFLDPAVFEQYFGPTVLGLAMTLFAATVIEVCSEGSAPIAGDIFNRAGAPGNAFAFMMAGVSTDYTEIMVLRQTTKSWKLTLFLPLLTIPQILLLGWWLNGL